MNMHTLSPVSSAMRGVSVPRICAALLGLFLSVGALCAQTGTIVGRVLNVTSERFIKNAQVQVVGTEITAVTDDTGDFILPKVPAGPVTLKVVYPGLDSQEIKLSVASGQIAEQMIKLTRGNIQAADTSSGVVSLDAFTVLAEKDTNAASIATNEQRYAANIKTVVSGDSFGDVPEGNVGEFLKYLPGIEAENNASEVRALSLRGFSSEMTGVAVDGSRAASPSSGNDNRGFDVRAVSVNNIARAEVIKVPLADLPADSLGGSVNLITRSAFESSKRVFNYNGGLSFNSESMTFAESAGPGEKRSYRVLPTFNFNYINPINKNFGITINGLYNNQFNENHRPGYNWRLTGGLATPTTPYLQNYVIQDGPSATTRASLSTKADWRISPGNVLSFGVTWSYYYFYFNNRNITYTTGNVTVSPTNPDPFSPLHTQGNLAGGSVVHGGSWRNFASGTGIANLKYAYNLAGWQGETGASFSRSNSTYRDTRDGYFQSYTTRLVDAGLGAPTVRLSNIVHLPNVPTVTVRNSTGTAPVDYNNTANYLLTAVTSSPTEGDVKYENAFLSTRRDFAAGSTILTLRTGFDVRRETRDNRRITNTWNYVGADRVANNADNNMAAFADTNYREDAKYGNGAIQWVTPVKMYNAFKTDPGSFVFQDVASERARIQGSSYLQETIPAYYLRVDAKLMGGRLQLVGGARHEQTQSKGTFYRNDPDAAFRNAQGVVVRNAAGARVRQSTTVAGSMEDLRLQIQERASSSSRSYGDFYPSAAAVFNATDDTLLRAAYAETIGRPSPTNILPLFTVDEADALGGVNQITMNNPALKPQFARSYDVTVEHYFPKGGRASVGGFLKDIYNFRTGLSSTLTPAIASDLGISQSYADGTWQVSTSTNGSHVRITGVEAVFEHEIPKVPQALGRFWFQTNGTVYAIGGEGAAVWPNFTRKIGNVVLRWNKGKFSTDLRYNYRGLKRQSQQSGLTPDLYQYLMPKGAWDFNINYRLGKYATFYFNARNFTNRADITTVYRPDTPEYARGRQTQSYGFPMYFGVKGSF